MELKPFTVKIPIYDWEITVYPKKFGISYTFDNLYRKMKAIKLDSEAVNKVKKLLVKDRLQGVTCSKLGTRKILILLSFGSEEDFWNVYPHEISHAIDGIVDNFGIHDTEARAYLTGYIYSTLFKKGLYQSFNQEDRLKTP